LTAAGERTAYVDRQIERMENWQILNVLTPQEGGAGNSAAALAHLGQLVQTWIEQAPADEQPVLEQFFNAVQQRYLLRLFRTG
jgi:hypothetical protein